HLVRTEIGLLVTFLASMLVAYVGLALTVSGQHRVVGVLVLCLGLWWMLSAPMTHDRLHLEAGEAGHALWGRNDRWKPGWPRCRRPGAHGSVGEVGTVAVPGHDIERGRDVRPSISNV